MYNIHMNKMNTKNIDKHFNVTILSTFTLLVIGVLVLLVSNIYYGLNIWIGIIFYLFVVNIPFIVFTVFHVLTLNMDSVSNSTDRIIIVHNKDVHVHKTNSDKCTKHLIIGA